MSKRELFWDAAFFMLAVVQKTCVVLGNIGMFWHGWIHSGFTYEKEWHMPRFDLGHGWAYFKVCQCGKRWEVGRDTYLKGVGHAEEDTGT